jgi:hypothetical protein
MMTISNYYRSKFGEPIRQAEFTSPEGIKVQVLKWSDAQTEEGVTMYATVGAHENLGSSIKSCEFFIGVTPEVDDIVDALAEVALSGNGSKEVPSSGDSITLSYDLWSGTNIRNFMFTDGSEIIKSVKNENGTNICFLQLVPLYESELRYKKSHGESALWEKFEANGIPYWNSSRGEAF